MAQLPRSDEVTFVHDVSAQTGIDPRVLIAWIRSEGHPGDLYNNWLNIAAPTARSLGVPTSGTAAANTAEFADVQTGVNATVKEIRNLGLTHLANETPRQEISDIAASPWASSHYGGPGGPNLLNVFTGIYGQQAAGGGYQGSGTVDWGPGGVQGAIGSAGSGVVGGIKSALSFPERAFDFLTSWRFAEVIGGTFLMLIGLMLLGRQFGLQIPGVAPPAVATRTQDSAAETFQFQPGERDYASRQPTSREGTPRRTKSYTLEADRPAPAPAASELEDVGIPF